MSAIVQGIGPDAPTATNAAGGKQSASPFRCDLLPPLATLAVAEVLAHGAAKYGANNWHSIPVEDHLNHALAHVFADRAGDTQDSHLEHAACRILMALEQKLAGRPTGEPNVKREPEPVPVSVAHSVAHSFRKDVVVIVSYDRLNEMTHTTTWGRTPQDKLTAAEWGDQFAALLCGPNAPRTTFEDFRTVDAAHSS